jgi:hypothetical protein
MREDLTDAGGAARNAEEVSTPEQGEHGPDARRRHVDIVVNNKPVVLTRHRVTGHEIKEAAIGQGVDIEFDFQLFEELPDGHERQIGNDDEVTVHDGSVFTAIAPDDNS